MPSLSGDSQNEKQSANSPDGREDGSPVDGGGEKDIGPRKDATDVNDDNQDETQSKQDVEAGPADQRADVLAKENYSVFTVPQKRAIILVGSFVGWFSPMSGSIYYPALNEASILFIPLLPDGRA